MGIWDGIVDALTTDDGERADKAYADYQKAQAEADKIYAELEAAGHPTQGDLDRLARAQAAAAAAGAAANAASAKANRPPVYQDPTAQAPADPQPAVVEEAPQQPAEPAAPAEAEAPAEPPAAKVEVPSAGGGHADKPKPKPKKPEGPHYRTYTVKKGDTLSEIGQRFGVNWREIAKLNHIKNPDLIFPGQEFKIPND